MAEGRERALFQGQREIFKGVWREEVWTFISAYFFFQKKKSSYSLAS